VCVCVCVCARARVCVCVCARVLVCMGGEVLMFVCVFVLTDRSQRVFVNNRMSGSILTNVGSPQGCVLSPLLFIFYTDDCRSKHNDRFLIKFADDFALLSLMYGTEIEYGPCLNECVSWCESSFLYLNVSKTKEMIFDFRTVNKCKPKSVHIHDEEVGIVNEYKYLGTVFDEKLTWETNTKLICKKSQQRLYFLRKLNSFSVDKTILRIFYKSFIESLLTFSSICWFFNLNVKGRNSLNRFISLSSKIIGEKQINMSRLVECRIINMGRKIVDNKDHILNSEFELLLSGRRFRSKICRTNRYRNSFIPTAIRLLNK